jgi:hypothetical protein
MKHLASIGCWLFVVPLFAHDIITTKLTYTRDIAPLFKKHCLSCHSERSSIPLTSYEQVRPWAVAIKEQVLSRAMPPWGGVKGFGDLAPDDGLTQEEIMIISAWVVGGAPGKLGALQDQNASGSPVDLAKLSDAFLISTRQRLRAPVLVCGIRPHAQGIVRSAQIIARLPDGSVEPLLWLYNYDSKLHRVFRFREPLQLPAGTLVKSSATLQFYLERLAKSPSRQP